jgi:hypothetical protein
MKGRFMTRILSLFGHTDPEPRAAACGLDEQECADRAQHAEEKKRSEEYRREQANRLLELEAELIRRKPWRH